MGSVGSCATPPPVSPLVREDDLGAVVHCPAYALPRGAGHYVARAGRGAPRCGGMPLVEKRASPPLEVIAHCYQPILFMIAGYAIGSPRDMANLCAASVCFRNGDLEVMADSLWEVLFSQRWPAFHECLCHHQGQDWCKLYFETLRGHIECALEVFDREKKRGFAMSAMPARVMFDAKRNLYIARYLSASKVLPEGIPVKEEHRLRFCPLSARERLLPNGVLEGSASLDKGRASLEQLRPPENRQEYPYRILEYERELVVGQGVELQWKMQRGSPFGWWYGILESLRRDEASGLLTARITFRHFPANSRWYQLDVRFGDGQMHSCDFGGFTGGLRAVTDAEKKTWAQFFPKDEVHF